MFGMFARFAWVLLAATATMSSAHAADLIEAPLAGCNCGSNMITIYDFEPGVVTRHWAECGCSYQPNKRGLSARSGLGRLSRQRAVHGTVAALIGQVVAAEAVCPLLAL